MNTNDNYYELANGNLGEGGHSERDKTEEENFYLFICSDSEKDGDDYACDVTADAYVRAKRMLEISRWYGEAVQKAAARCPKFLERAAQEHQHLDPVFCHPNPAFFAPITPYGSFITPITPYGAFKSVSPTYLHRSPLHFLLDLHPWRESDRKKLDNTAVRDAICREPNAAIETYWFPFFGRVPPIFPAISLGASLDVVERLHCKLPDALLHNSEGKTPLHFACMFKASFEVVQFLIEQHPHAVQEKDHEGYTPLTLAREFHAPSEVIQLLVDLTALNEVDEVLDCFAANRKEEEDGGAERQPVVNFPFKFGNGIVREAHHSFLPGGVGRGGDGGVDGYRGDGHTAALAEHHSKAGEDELRHTTNRLEQSLDSLEQNANDMVDVLNPNNVRTELLRKKNDDSMSWMRLVSEVQQVKEKAEGAAIRTTTFDGISQPPAAEKSAETPSSGESGDRSADDPGPESVGELPVETATSEQAISAWDANTPGVTTPPFHPQEHTDVLHRLLDLRPWNESDRRKFDNAAVREALAHNTDGVRETYWFRFGFGRVPPIFPAVSLGASIDVVERLHCKLPNGILKKTSYGTTPLHFACMHKAPCEVVQFLIEKHPQAVHEKDGDGYTPLHFASMHNAPFEVVRFLIEEHPQAVQERDGHGETPLSLARCFKSQLQVAQLLANVEANLEALRRCDLEKAQEILKDFVNTECWGGISLVLEKFPLLDTCPLLAILLDVDERLIPNRLAKAHRLFGLDTLFKCFVRERADLFQIT